MAASAATTPADPFTSITPPVLLMLPLPSETKVPTMVTKLPDTSVPVAENTYVPLRLLLLKLPLGGGVTTGLLFPLPQPARTASDERITGRMRRVRSDMTSP